jgi:hypothetical protein
MAGTKPPVKAQGEVYFEFVSIGGSVKVNAIDPVTGVEASIVAPVNTVQSDLERLALAKLRRMVEKKTGGP